MWGRNFRVSPPVPLSLPHSPEKYSLLEKEAETAPEVRASVDSDPAAKVDVAACR